MQVVNDAQSLRPSKESAFTMVNPSGGTRTVSKFTKTMDSRFLSFEPSTGAATSKVSGMAINGELDQHIRRSKCAANRSSA